MPFTKPISLKNRTKLIVLVCSGLLIPDFSIAQVKSLSVKYNFIINGGNRDGSRVTIERDGQKWRARDGDDGKNNIELEYQHDYVFSFSKQGYVTKKIFISTKVPKSVLKDGFDPYSFDITIFKQMEGVNIVVFNQPVAKVVYKEDIDDFGFDTDYTKSVLSGIQDAEKELKQKAKEEKANPKPVNVNTTPANQSTETTNKSSSEGDATPSSSAETTKKNSNEGDSKLKGETENGDRGKAPAKTEAENREMAPGVILPDKRDEKQYVDGNKRITEITITRKGKTFVYKKVAYIWGVFYFRDNISITESSFIQEAL